MAKHIDKALLVTIIILVVAVLVVGGIAVGKVVQQRDTGAPQIPEDGGSGKVYIRIAAPGNATGQEDAAT